MRDGLALMRFLNDSCIDIDVPNGARMNERRRQDDGIFSGMTKTQ